MLIGILAFASGFYLLFLRNRAGEIRAKADSIQVHILNARRWEKNFLLRERKSAAFQERTGPVDQSLSTRYLSQHREAMNQLRQEITELCRIAHNYRLQCDQLKVRSQEYEAAFQKVVEAYWTRGVYNTGLTAIWRDAGDQLHEAVRLSQDPLLEQTVLALRRREEEYLLSDRLSADEVVAATSHLREVVANSSADQAVLNSVIDQYLQAFETCAEYDTQIGPTADEGLRGKVSSAADVVEQVAGEVANLAADEEDMTVMALLASIVLLLLLGTTLTAYV